MAVTAQIDVPTKRQSPDSGPDKFMRGDIYSGIFLDFDGVNDYMDVGDTGGDCMTVICWIKPTSTTEKIIDFDGGTHALEIISGVVTATGFDTPVIYVDGSINVTTVSAGAWFMIAVTTNTIFDVDDLDIGRVGATYYDGGISNVFIFDIVLNAETIKKFWHNPARFPNELSTDNLVAHYPLNEGNDNYGVALDYAPNHNQGVITGATYANGEGGDVMQNLCLPSVYGEFFDGTDDYLNNDSISADFSITKEWTLVFKLITPPDNLANYTIFSTANSSSDAIAIGFISPGIVGFTYYNGTSNVKLSYSGVSVNEYAEIICTMSNGITSLTYNGNNSDGTSQYSITTTNKTVIGARTNNSRHYKGLIFSVEQLNTHKWTIFNGWVDEIGGADMTINGSPDQLLLTPGATTLKDAFTLSAFPNTGKYGVFRGAEKVRIIDNSLLGITTAVSIACWIKLTSTGAQVHVVDRTNAYNLIISSADKIIFGFYQTSLKFVTGSTTLVADTWYYIGGSFDGTTTKVFLNGVLDNSSTSHSGAIDAVDDYTWIGALSGSSQFVNGCIDEVKIYGKALDDQQWLQNYRAQIGSHQN